MATVPATDKGFHQPRCHAHDAAAQGLGHGARAAAEPQAQVIELDDASDEAVDTRRHDQRNAHQHTDLGNKGRSRHCAQRDGNDLGREDEIGADSALDLVALELHQVHSGCRSPHGPVRPCGLRLLLSSVQQPVRQFFGPFVAQERRRQPSAAASPAMAQRR
jgi:hypothetical protein